MGWHGPSNVTAPAAITIGDQLLLYVPSVAEVLCRPPCVGLRTYPWTDRLLARHGIRDNASLMDVVRMPGLVTGVRRSSAGYDKHLQKAHTSVDITGERLPGLGRWPIELRHVTSHVLHGRTHFRLFWMLLDAELVWAHAEKQLAGAHAANGRYPLLPFPHPS